MIFGSGHLGHTYISIYVVNILTLININKLYSPKLSKLYILGLAKDVVIFSMKHKESLGGSGDGCLRVCLLMKDFWQLQCS